MHSFNFSGFTANTIACTTSQRNVKVPAKRHHQMMDRQALKRLKSKYCISWHELVVHGGNGCQYVQDRISAIMVALRWEVTMPITTMETMGKARERQNHIIAIDIWFKA